MPLGLVMVRTMPFCGLTCGPSTERLTSNKRVLVSLAVAVLGLHRGLEAVTDALAGEHVLEPIDDVAVTMQVLEGAAASTLVQDFPFVVLEDVFDGYDAIFFYLHGRG